jgi:hypothetical protein
VKKIIYGIVISIIFTIFVGCSTKSTNTLEKPLKSMTLEEIYQGNLSEVSKIEIRRGSGELKTITDKAIVQEWLISIKDINFVPDKNQDIRKGYLYYVKLFVGEDVKLYFDSTEIYDFYYERNEQILEKLELLFNEN